MPGSLNLLGRKLPFGSDDLIFPGVVGAITRSFMTVGFAICLGFGVNAGDSTACPNRIASPVEIGFLASSFVFSCFHTIVYYWMIKISLMDTILDFKPRLKKSEMLINILAFTYLLEIGLASFGIFVVAGNPCDSQSTAWIVELSAVVVLWFDICSALATAFVFYRYFTPGHTQMVSWYQVQLKRIGWAFSYLSCGILGNIDSPEGYGENSWLQFAEVVHKFLHDMMTDLVVTDVLAALLLLRVEQKRMRDRLLADLAERALSIGSMDPTLSPGTGFNSPISPGTINVQTFLWGTEANQRVKLKVQHMASATPISPRGGWVSNLLASEGRVASPARRLEAFQALEEFASFSPYQEGIYGWKLFAYSTPLKFLAYSFKWIRFPRLFSRRANNRNVKSKLEGRIFSHVTGLSDHHILYASFTAYLGESIPYTICVDHDREAVVVSLRGTLSFQDLVTDLMCTPVELESTGKQWGFDGKGHYAHGGMLQVAARIRLDIEKQQILHNLFHTAANDDDLLPNGKPVQVIDMYESEAYFTKQQIRETDVSRYRLMIVGHSLGGGVAAILSLMLRSKFPNLHCLAYEPPGCIFSRELAENSCEWVNSIVCGLDAIPRLSWHNVKHLRGLAFEMLRRSKTNKATILSTIFRNIPAEDLLYDLQSVPQEEIRNDLANKIKKLAMDDDSILDTIRMYLPGKILHLAKGATVRNHCCHRDRFYSPMWVEDRTDFHDIQISQYLLWNHFPDYNGVVIKKTLREALKAEGRVSFGDFRANSPGLFDAINPKLEI